MMPAQEAPGKLDSLLTCGTSAQSHFCQDIQAWKILGTLFFGGQVTLKYPGYTSPPEVLFYPDPTGPENSFSQDVPSPASKTPHFDDLPSGKWPMLLVLWLKSLKNNSLFVIVAVKMCTHTLLKFFLKKSAGHQCSAVLDTVRLLVSDGSESSQDRERGRRKGVSLREGIIQGKAAHCPLKSKHCLHKEQKRYANM